MIWVRVKFSFSYVLVGVCYKPPHVTVEFVRDLCINLDDVISRYPGCPVFLGGDFNYPGIDWISCEPLPDCRHVSECIEFLNVLKSLYLSQVVLEPTRGTSILDLFFTTAPDIIKRVNVLEEISDHKMVVIEVEMATQHPRNQIKEIHDYSKAKSNEISTVMSIFLDNFERSFRLRSVEENWSAFKNQLNRILNDFVPRIKIPNNPLRPWFSKKLKSLLNKKKRLYNRAMESDDNLSWDLYNTHSSICALEIKKAKRTFYRDDLNGLLKSNPKKFWNCINPPKTSSNRSFTNAEGNRCTDLETANNFNECFSEVFTNESFPLPSCELTYDHAFLEKITVCSRGIGKIIESLPYRSSPGIDGINTKLLKITQPFSSDILALLYQQSLEEGHLPNDWKHAKIIPVHKSGDTSSLNNYRPISLTSIPCKILEHIIYSHIINFVLKNNILFEGQHGFRKGKSCETQLFELITDLYENVHSLQQTDIIFLDFSRAFDCVPHQRLLQKLETLNMDPSLIFWIRQFLTNRTQSVAISNQLSSSTDVKSGVPQGSVLGPLLFLIYINDLPINISSSIRLFADDCVLYKKIVHTADTCTLQSDLNSIASWCNRWQMRINIDKTKCMTVTTKKSSISCNYAINGVPLEKVNKYKYLGVFISDTLGWHDHINYIVGKASRSLGFIRRKLYLAPPETRLLAFKSFVRSQLEYASIIWSPHQDYLIAQIEKIQNKAARFIYSDYSPYTSVSALKQRANLPLLDARRKVSRLAFIHNIYYFDVNLKERLLPPPHRIFPRHDHPHKIRLSNCRTNQFRYSPLQLAITEWNSLPHHVVNITDKNEFKSTCERLFHFSQE